MQGRAEASGPDSGDYDVCLRFLHRAPSPSILNSLAYTRLAAASDLLATVHSISLGGSQSEGCFLCKVRESWTNQEHQKFLDAIKLYNRDWKKIEEFIGTKSVKQIRSHAQKYFLKVQKHGGTDFIPPARPKRKASPTHSSSSRRSPDGTPPQPPSPFRINTPAPRPPVPAPVPVPQPLAQSQPQANPSAMFSHWMSANGLAPPPGLIMPAPVFPTHTLSNALNALAPLLPGNHSLPDDIARLRRTQEQFALAQMSLNNAMNAAAPYSAPSGAPPQKPNYAKIYAFLGSLFDPATDNHVEALNYMSPVDRDTVQVMMNNLAVNLHNSISMMERGSESGHHGSNGMNGSHSLHPLPKEPLPLFRSERPRLSEDVPLAADGRSGFGMHSIVHPAIPAFGNPRREAGDDMPPPSLHHHQFLELPQQLRHEHGALYSTAGADYYQK